MSRTSIPLRGPIAREFLAQVIPDKRVDCSEAGREFRLDSLAAPSLSSSTHTRRSYEDALFLALQNAL
jgi:hypothetical protein